MGSPETTNSAEPQKPKLALSFSAPPIELQGIAARFVNDIPYDEYSRTVFDILLPESSEPTALIVYIHGGAFVFGDKSAAYSEENAEWIRQALTRNVAFATINYRLVTEQDEEGLAKPLHDSKRALQFMRYYSSALNISADDIAAYGVSAGGTTSLWLAYHNDMSEPFSSDPISRESTRLSVAAAEETQASYDLERWADEIFNNYGYDTEQLLALSGLNEFRSRYYGISYESEISSESTIEYRKELHLIDHMSIDDPAVFIRNDDLQAEAPTTMSLQYHHANHALALKNKAQQLGMQGIYYIPELGITDPSEEELMPFLLRHLL